MWRCSKVVCVAVAIGLCLGARAQAKPTVAIGHQKPCNVLPAGRPVRFEAELKGFPAGAGEAVAGVTGYFGERAWTGTQPLRVEPGKPTRLSLEVGTLDAGYYELNISARVQGANGKPVEATEMASFGIAPFVSRTAEEVRAGGYRFGLKTWQVDDVWWRRPLQWHLSEAVDACANLGLQWTRHQFNQAHSELPGMIGTADLVRNHPMNAVLKIEGFPEACYDAQRYGPREEWVKKNGPHWSRWTVPRKEPYRAWLRDEIARIPASQVVFEIGNEPWGQMSPEEFAELCQLILPVVKEARPNAVVGPNTALGSIDWERRFIAAGGLRGMGMVTVHPYSFTPPPELRTRLALRNYRDFLRARLGRDLPLYVTEYGWSTAPQDRRKQSVSERQQAQRTVRQSLMLYAEDMKTLIPHWMADREHDPTEREHFFGFFRLNEQPKPVVMAHAACARMIDGARFVGDLWYGPGVGAMLFERKGTHTLALWTLDEEPGSGRDLQVDVGRGQVTLVDIMGREKPAPAAQGKLTLRVSADMTYLVGVSPDLARQAAGPDQELNPELWATRDGSFTLSRAATPPRIDGLLDDWAGAKAIPFLDVNRSNPGRDDCSGQAMLKWDKEHLYAAVQVRDDRLVAAPEGKGLDAGDVVELSISTRPTRQPSLGGWLLYDYTLRIAPVGLGGKPALQLANNNWEKPLSSPAPGDASGVRWSVVPTQGGWCGEVAIPLRLLDGFPPPQPGRKLACFAQMREIDAPDEPRLRMACSAAEQPYQWPWLTISD